MKSNLAGTQESGMMAVELMKGCRSLLLIGAFASGAALAAPPTTTIGKPGDSVASQTTTVPVYTTKSGTQFGGYSTTTVTGGVAANGSGGLIPNGTSGSASSTTYGVGFTIPIK